jgi:predicted phosphate transport protein (TIGR00153 family)
MIVGIVQKLLRLRGEESTILELFVKHAEISLNCTKLVHRIILDYFSGKQIQENCKKLDLLEDENDSLNALLNAKLFKGNLLPYTNEDWSALASMIDSLSDISERISRLLLIKKIKVPKQVNQKIRALSESNVKIISLVYETVMYMRKDFKLATAPYESIARMRHDARRVEYEIYALLYKSKLGAKDIAVLKDVVYWTAQLANTSKRIAKHVARISVKYA